jgi:hypothetical protein
VFVGMIVLFSFLSNYDPNMDPVVFVRTVIILYYCSPDAGSDVTRTVLDGVKIIFN